MVSLDDFALSLGNNGLELLSLSNYLLLLGVKFVSQLNIFLEECIPFTGALLFFTFKFLHKASHADYLL